MKKAIKYDAPRQDRRRRALERLQRQTTPDSRTQSEIATLEARIAQRSSPS